MRLFPALLLAALLVLPAAAFAKLDFPPLTGRVVDQAAILPPEAVAQLTKQLAAHEQQTSQQVVVATVKSLDDTDIADYGYQLGRAWGIGQKDKNNGALLIVAPNEREVRIEVGYGLEQTLTDAASTAIIQQVILPRFRDGDLTGGIMAGTATMLRVLGGDENAVPQQSADATSTELGWPTWLIIILIVFFLWRRGIFVPFSSFGGRGGGGGGGGFSGGGGSFGGGGSSGKW